jgi:two-component system, NarL family, response regulator DevR
VCKVLIADDSDVMRKAIRQTLEEESSIKIVGEAGSFGQAMQMVNDLKPDVLLLDLHMAEKRDFTPELVKSQLGTVCTLAVSFSNDADSKALAESYGAKTLLDKMNLYTEMLPAIRLCHPALGQQRPMKHKMQAA